MDHHDAVRLDGHLVAWWETGTEGVYWSLVTDWSATERSHDNLYVLEEGDVLTIFNEDGSVAWHGKIAWDLHTRRLQSPFNSDRIQQEVAGLWVHGLQRGVDAETWADYFMGHEMLLPTIRQQLRSKPLRALLYRPSPHAR
ncbi:MAG: hypothetical protein C0497_12910 [Gemmatimonas sp.]|nr:hypothetical protein [Gemmatimonas sp.]